MDKLKLRFITDPILLEVLPSFSFEDPVIDIEFAESELFRLMDEHNGLGLSANQAGIPARMFAMKLKNGKKLFCVNPVVVKSSQILETKIEGCLSDPGAKYPINRPRKCFVDYYSSEGIPKGIQLTGIDARCAQHEIDHLNGINIRSKHKSTQTTI